MTTWLIMFFRAFSADAVTSTLADRWANVIHLNTDPQGRSEVTVDEGRLG